jgi:hypothetical protein
LKIYYNDIYKGYFEYKKTLKLIRRKYFWPEMTRDIKKYVVIYDICQRIHIPRHRPYGELHPFLIPERLNQNLFINFITDLLSCKKRKNIQVYDNILIMIDRYSKLAKYIATRKNLTAEGLVILII